MPKKEINLLPHEDFEKRPLGRFLLWALNVGRWIVITVELIVILAFLSRFKFDRDRDNLYESIRAKQAVIQASADFEQDFRLFQKRLVFANKLSTQQLPTIKIISAIAAITPPDVALSNLLFENGQINLTGMALSETGLKSFLAGLNFSPAFDDITLSGVTKQKEDGGGLKFTLTANINTQELK